MSKQITYQATTPTMNDFNQAKQNWTMHQMEGYLPSDDNMRDPEPAKMMTVRVPRHSDSLALSARSVVVEVTIPATCPKCGGPRGEAYPGLTFDGSIRLHVSQWNNPCGHIDQYTSVLREAEALGTIGKVDPF